MSITAGLERRTDYGELCLRLRAAGLLDRRTGYYTFKIASTLLVVAAGWAGFALLGNSWATLGIAAFLGLAFNQVVFLGHDAGHQQICSSRRSNRRLGLVVGNLLTGLSFGWWVPKHNAHHAFPNQEDRDPDIAAGVISFTAAHTAARRGVGRVFSKHQAALFFPLLFLEGLNLHVASVQTLRRQRADRSVRAEVILLSVHAALYLGAVFVVLPVGKAVAFIAVQQGVFGFCLGCSFAPNHKGMPLITPESERSFAHRQVITARNVKGGWLGSFLLGGLDYQIEHHLFPTMPRPNLGRAQPYVRAFCLEHDLPYREDTVVSSYRQTLRHLRSIGSGAGADPLDPAGPLGPCPA
ncbi:MAG: acyl-CoA desaturase [Actinomycetota bacterium]|nr:acyl-CoA desaturase [Actinomycetota bacterium]